MKYILSIIFVFISLLAYSKQDTVFIRYNISDYVDSVSYKTDTILFRGELSRQILIGTTVLPSGRQLNARHYGLYLQNVTLEPCGNDGRGYFDEETKITSIIETKDKLDISIKITDNCCYSFLCEVDVIDEKTINLITLGYGNFCACYCCFGLTFHFEKIEFGENTDVEYAKLESIIINGQENTRQKIR